MLLWIKNNYQKIFIFLIYFLTFIYLIFPYSDFDWGWHFKYGEYFFKNGKILRDEIFSWTMPYYKWANHSWLYDIILYLNYTKLGFLGLSISGALVASLIFFVATFSFKLSYLQLGFLSLLYILISNVNFTQALRSQYFGLLLITILTFLLIRARKNKKILFFIPPLFLLWANLHGTFTLGFIILTVFLISNIFTKNKDHFWPLLLVTAISFFLTLVNPFTYRIYIVGLKHFSNPWLTNIIEWLPSTYCRACNFPFFILFMLILAIQFIKRKKASDIPFIIILVFLAYQAIIHRRYLSMFMAFALPYISFILSEANEAKKKMRDNKYISLMFFLTLLGFLAYAIFLKIPKYNLFSYSFRDYCKYSTNCSVDMAEFLLKNPPKGKGLNFYDWGGFLIGYGINTKLFIDGRMHLWSYQGHMPFYDYMESYYAGNLNLFNSFDFDWIIARHDAPVLKNISENPMIWGFWRIAYTDDKGVYLVKIR